MREVGAPHDAIPRDEVLHLEDHRVADDAEVEVLPHVLAGLFLQGDAEPVFEELVVVVHEEEAEGQPARVGLGEVHFEVGIAVEHARGDELGHAVDGRVRSGPLAEGAGPGLAAGAAARAADRRPDIAEAEVRRQLHADVERRLPELVVLFTRRAGAVGELVEGDGPDAEILDPLELRHGVLDTGDGNHGVADEPIGGYRVEVLGQEGVVGLDHREVDLGVDDALEEAGGEDGREEDFGVDAVLVLLAEALLGGAGAGGGGAVLVVVGHAPEADRLTGDDVLAVMEERLPFDKPALAAVGEMNQAGGAVAPLLRHVLDPRFGRRLHVPVP